MVMTKGMALACEAADDVEAAWREHDNWEAAYLPLPPDDSDYEQWCFEEEEVERTTLTYRHALQQLWRARADLSSPTH